MGAGSIYKSEEGKRAIQQHYDNYLQRLGFDVERMTLETSFGKTHMLVAGPQNGEPLFIFQGGNCINPMTLCWFTPLTEKYRVYAPDTIGHPGFSEETRISAKDASFAQWVKDLMDHFQIEKSGFIGPSYGGGIILRIASFMPERIACAVLVSPAGIRLGSKVKMIKDILIPLILLNTTSSPIFLHRIADHMSNKSMKTIDRQILGDVFKYLKLEQDMPKLTTREELNKYDAPTLVIAGQNDLFFPAKKLGKAVKEIIPNITAFISYDMGHFPSDENLIKINRDIQGFLEKNYQN